MVHDRTNWRMKARRAASALISAALPLAFLGASAVHAQNFMRSPSIESRIPTINPTVAPRINPRISVTGIDRTTPNLRIYQACSYAYRDSDGQCRDRPVSSFDGGGGGGVSGNGKNNSGPRRNTLQTALNPRTIPGEIVAEIDGSLSTAQADELARRHGLARLQLLNFPLLDATIALFRVTDRRPVETVSRGLASAAGVRSVQPNFRHMLQDQKAALTEGDPAQYALAKLRLPEAHTLAHGANVTIAVIDSGVDLKHPELANAIADSFDALGSKEGPHAHGTGIAGAIVAHARLMGSAPAARILAIRAFGAAPNGAESTSFVVLKALGYAAAHGAQIVNMSFAGPKDGLIERAIAATAAKGIVMVAASGNAGPKSPPLYPAANANVIAVSATDAQDRLFAASNRGSHIAVAAPGVDIFLPAPDEKYQMASGTSFSAAYVSGLAALMLERNPALKPDEVRAILMKTARDLGAPGRDDLFGAGEADAYAAVSAVAAPAVPVAAAPDSPAAEKVSDRQDVPATKALNEPAPNPKSAAQ
ncbi:MAG TPA: S8 family serine peptidase [Bradyrhizobium sp.]|jgi:subtilisin family serine protease|nr:S8 family serine peptidase [Bradyrhizobium sp.]